MVSEAIQFRAQPPTKLIKGTTRGEKFILKLESYQQLSATFKSFLSQVRDTFYVQHVNFSHSPGGKKHSLGSTSGTKKTNIPAKFSSADESSRPMLSSYPSGIPLQNSDKIMSGMNDFISRVSNILELVSTLGQFTRLNLEQRINGLPRFSGLWTLEFFEGSEGKEGSDSLGQSFNQSEGVSMRAGTVPGDGSVSDITLATPDYLDMLISKNAALLQQQHLQVVGGGGMGLEGEGGGGRSGLHSGALSTLKEESWVGSAQSEGEEETDHKPQGTYMPAKITMLIIVNSTSI